MRFTILASIALFAGLVAAAPYEKRDFITALGKALKEAEDDSGLTAALERLDKASKGRVSALEDDFGITDLENILGITDDN